MKLTAPHWLTAVAGGLGIVASSLVATNSFPSLTPYLAGFAALCTAVTVPGVQKS